MNEKERLRKAIFEMVKQHKLTLLQASLQCELSYRQTLRIYARYQLQGDVGLTHQSRGQRSTRKNPHQDAIIARYMERYEGFGPTLATEYLLEDGYDIHHETLRLWLLSKGLWKKIRKRSPYRQRRERYEQFGALVQIDGSIHDWFKIGKNSCLLNMVDDATGKTLSQLDGGETTRVVFHCLWKWIDLYGIPLALYVDLKSVYVSPKDNGFSHVQVACGKLGIRIIKARSPQAKGRVERNHAVYQDRYVKELGLQQVTTVEAGNAILDKGFIEKLNKKFEKPAQNPVSAHRPLGGIDLNQIFCWEYERQVQNDWTFSFDAKTYQIKKDYGSCVKPKSKIKVRRHLNGNISCWNKEEQLKVELIPTRTKKAQLKVVAKKNKHNIIKKITDHSRWGKINDFIFAKQDKQKIRATLRKRSI